LLARLDVKSKLRSDDDDDARFAGAAWRKIKFSLGSGGEAGQLYASSNPVRTYVQGIDGDHGPRKRGRYLSCWNFDGVGHRYGGTFASSTARTWPKSVARTPDGRKDSRLVSIARFILWSDGVKGVHREKLSLGRRPAPSYIHYRPVYFLVEAEVARNREYISGFTKATQDLFSATGFPWCWGLGKGFGLVRCREIATRDFRDPFFTSDDLRTGSSGQIPALFLLTSMVSSRYNGNCDVDMPRTGCLGEG